MMHAMRGFSNGFGQIRSGNFAVPEVGRLLRQLIAVAILLRLVWSVALITQVPRQIY